MTQSSLDFQQQPLVMGRISGQEIVIFRKGEIIHQPKNCQTVHPPTAKGIFLDIEAAAVQGAT